VGGLLTNTELEALGTHGQCTHHMLVCTLM
jgi:hypothetical protein